MKYGGEFVTSMLKEKETDFYLLETVPSILNLPMSSAFLGLNEQKGNENEAKEGKLLL